MRHIAPIAAVVALAGACHAGPPQPGRAAPPALRPGAAMRLMSLPLSFEPNRGQFDPRVRFRTSAGGGTVFLTDREAVMVLPGKPIVGPDRDLMDRTPVRRGRSAVLRMKLVGARNAPRFSGAQRLPGVANYAAPGNPRRTLTGVPTYGRAKFDGVYPGTDLVYYGNSRQLEYDFILQPGADPGRIKLAFSGAQALRLAANGDLVATTNVGNVCWKRPFAYQMSGDRRVQVACDYAIAPGSSDVGFRLASYDTTRPLVVDPVLVYATYVGGSGADEVYSVATDALGATYLTGRTLSAGFPGYGGAAIAETAYAVRLNPAGTAVDYSTYLRGNAVGNGIAVYGRAACVVGRTISAGHDNAFVAWLDSAGALAGDKVLTRARSNSANAVAIGPGGNAYVVGQAQSTVSPVGNYDAFLTVVSPALSVVWTQDIGGSGYDYAYGVAVDAAGATYITGATTSSSFPTTVGAFQPYFGGVQDAFVTRVNVDGSIGYSTLLGGLSADVGYGIAVDSAGSAYVTGCTTSSDFPTTPGALRTALSGTQDAFVTKLDATGSVLSYSTLLGGSGPDAGYAIGLATSGAAWVCGATRSADFPIFDGAYSTPFGGQDAFVARIGRDGRFATYSTYLGGSVSDAAYGCAVDSIGAAHIGGSTSSGDFAVTAGASQTVYAGGLYDGFAAMVTGPAPTELDATTATCHRNDVVRLSAHLTASGVPVPGQPVRFYVDGSEVAVPTTDAAGLATYDYSVPASTTIGDHAIDVVFAGSSQFDYSTASGILHVTKRATKLVTTDTGGTVGSSVTLSATLSDVDTGGLLADKMIDFTIGGASVGSGLTNASGVASCVYAIPEEAVAGTSALVAAFAEDSDYLASTSTKTFTITAAATTLVVENAEGLIPGEVTLTATLKRGTTRLAGMTVTFSVDGATVGTATTDAAGVATYTYSIVKGVAEGDHTLRADYAGDGGHLASNGTGTLKLTIYRAPTALAAADLTCRQGRAAALTAILTAGGTPLSGKSIAFSIDGVLIGSATTDAAGLATYSLSGAQTSALTLGDRSLTVAFAGDTENLPSSGSAVLTILNPAGITVVNVTPRTVTIGADTTLTAEVALASPPGTKLSGKTVSFEVDGIAVGSAVTAATPGGGVEASLTVSTATLAAGSHTIRATFAADADYDGSVGTAALTINKVVTTLTTADVTVTKLASTTLSATLTYSTPGVAFGGQTINFKLDGVSIGTGVTNAAGVATYGYTANGDARIPHSLVVEFVGDATYAASSDTKTLTITPLPSLLYVSPKTAAVADRVILTATFYSGANKVAGKTIAFAIDGVPVGTGTTSAAGVAAFTINPVPDSLGVGAHTITASFTADDTYAAATGTAGLAVTAAVTRIDVTNTTILTGGVGPLKGVLARLGGYLSGRTLTFKVNGTTVGTAVTNAVGAATLSYTASLPDGNYPIAISFAGDATNLPAAATGLLIVGLETTTIYVGPRTVAVYDKPNLGAQLKGMPTGRAIIGRTLTFTIDGTVVGSAVTAATPVNGAAFLMAFPIPDTLLPGTHTLAASYAGDTLTKPSSGSGTLTVTKAISGTSAASVTVTAGGTTTLSAVVASNGGPAAGRTVTFKIDGSVVGTGTTSAAGKATLTYTAAVPPGSHLIRAEFAGDAILVSSFGTGTLTVKP